MSVSRPKKNRLTKLAEARKRIEGKKKIVDPYRRTGGFGLSQGQKTKIALETVSYTHLTLPTNREV